GAARGPGTGHRSPAVRAPAQQRFYAARLAGTSVFDPIGDVVAKVRDVVVLPQERGPARAVGFVVEVAGKRRVFLPLTRVTSISPGQVISTGLLNVRRFEKRAGELLVIGDLLDRVVTLRDGSGEASVQDIALDRDRHREWTLSRLHLRRRRAGSSRSRLVSPRGGALTREQSAHLLAASYRDLNPADLAEILQELDPKRRIELAGELADERLADVIEELPEDTRVEVVTGLEAPRAAAVLDAMDPDDAADLV